MLRMSRGRNRVRVVGGWDSYLTTVAFVWSLVLVLAPGLGLGLGLGRGPDPGSLSFILGPLVLGPVAQDFLRYSP